MHADGYAGFEGLHRRGDIKEVICLAHIWRKLFDIHAANGSNIAKEPLERIAALCRIEASIYGKSPDERRSIKQEPAASLIDNLEARLHSQLTQISGKSALTGAIRYGLTRLRRLWPYLDDGRLSIDSNAAERGMRSIALGRKNSHDRLSSSERAASFAQSETHACLKQIAWYRALRSTRRLLKLSFGDPVRPHYDDTAKRAASIYLQRYEDIVPKFLPEDSLNRSQRPVSRRLADM